MNKNIIFDPSYGTLNMGDLIIVESALEELNPIICNDFNVRVSSHVPLYHFYQNFTRNIYKEPLKTAKRKFILGSNLLFKDFFLTRKRPWNIHFLTSKSITDVILVGVGSNGNNKRSSWYTKQLYKKILNKELSHSVRDHNTYDYVTNVLGLKAINTGCPTMWNLTKNHCLTIPTEKSNNAIFTLTDYARDKDRDIYMINTLLSLYKKVYFWPQGSEDANYLNELNVDHTKINIISSNIIDYKNILCQGDLDYVGSRLHGGIYALKNKIRTIIIAVDDRALNKKIDYNLPVIKREDIEENLVELITNSRETDIRIDEEAINEWKAQFK
uniref:Polysaccharide pyruvyl transferase family protein n=1 Tax=Erysipelothrix tonsillarum TaxID=38402 RepID=A0A6S6I1A9_9FIRM|nr:polysaccharide pyruvyl transferase family protein [Erysipelothrix tonsillarum]